MSNNNVIICMVICLLFLGCGQRIENKSSDVNLRDSNSINLRERKWDSTLQILGIDNIQKQLGKDQVIIWIQAPGLTDSAKVLVCKSIGSQWIGEFHEYRLIENGSLSKKIARQKIIRAQPKSSWDNLFAKFDKLGLFSLQKIDLKENLELCINEGTIVVEIVKNRKYSKYIYPCWSSIPDQSSVQKVLNILREAEKEFVIQIFPLETPSSPSE